MKPIINLLLATLLLASCSTITIIHSHEEVMNSFKTKEQIIEKLGLPTDKRFDGIYEEWYYNFGTKSVTSAEAEANRSSNIAALINGFSTAAAASAGHKTAIKVNENVNSSASATVVKENVNSFVKFTFKESKVINWKSNGVNYKYYQLVNKKTNQEIGSPSFPRFN